MKNVCSIALLLAALLAMTGCTENKDAAGPSADGAVVEEDTMPKTYEERTYAATEDSDRGDLAREKMDRADRAIRQSGEDVARDGKDAVKDVARDGKNMVKDAAHDGKNMVKDVARDGKDAVEDVARGGKNMVKDALTGESMK